MNTKQLSQVVAAVVAVLGQQAIKPAAQPKKMYQPKAKPNLGQVQLILATQLIGQTVAFERGHQTVMGTLGLVKGYRTGSWVNGVKVWSFLPSQTGKTYYQVNGKTYDPSFVRGLRLAKV